MKKLSVPERDYQNYLRACRYDFSTFVCFAFKTLYPHKPYMHNWHIDALAEQLMRSANKQCPRLIIGMPPRMLKSFITSIAYPAWVLGNSPSAHVMCISYGDELVKDFGLASQALMQSEGYRRIFPSVTLSKRRNSYSHIQLVRTGGCRMGITAGGAITGRGADIIIIDDPLKASDARTKERESINQWFDDNIYQRLNNKNEGAIILVMQRLHENDLTGHLLEKPEPWTHLKLPAIAEQDHVYELPDGGEYLRKTGAVLHPMLESLERLNNFKANQGSYVFASQYQQEPASDTEALIQSKNFVIEPMSRFPESYARIVQSWDTAHKVEESNDYSVGITIGYENGHYYILNVIRKRMKFQEILDTMQKSNSYNTRRRFELLVEDAASGQNIIQMLRGKGTPVKAFKPIGDKFTRLSGVSGIIESQFVHLPEGASWLQDFLLEVTRFPHSKHDDQVDALSQGLHYLNDAKRPRGFFDMDVPMSVGVMPRGLRYPGRPW